MTASGTFREDALDSQVIIVTGGGRGIGEAISRACATAGAQVVVVARSGDEVSAVARSIEGAGGTAMGLTADVSETDSVRALCVRVNETWGQIDTVVNNAGINPASALGTPEAVDPEAITDLLEVNLTGAFRTIAAAAPSLVEREGSIINVASVGGLVGLPRQHPYVASKHGLVGITKSMAIDLAPEVRVNAVAPGYVATQLTAPLQEDARLQASILDRTPLGRFAEPAEVAAPVVFLASDAAAYMTGTVLSIDGGWTAR
jgi:3-oxoacyl-[acyl-carrier protein] reductase